jgi:hypothetical protein
MDFNSIYDALNDHSPGAALRRVAIQMAQAGSSREQIIMYFERFLEEFRARGIEDETTEELIFDTVDTLNGWCHPAARLLTDERE